MLEEGSVAATCQLLSVVCSRLLLLINGLHHSTASCDIVVILVAEAGTRLGLWIVAVAEILADRSHLILIGLSAGGRFCLADTDIVLLWREVLLVPLTKNQLLIVQLVLLLHFHFCVK